MKIVEAIKVNPESSMVFRQTKLLSVLHGPGFDGQVMLESGMNSDVQPMKVARDCLGDN